MTNQRHHLTLLRAAGKTWAVCSCGWESAWAYRAGVTGPHLAFGSHLLASLAHEQGVRPVTDTAQLALSDPLTDHEFDAWFGASIESGNSA